VVVVVVGAAVGGGTADPPGAVATGSTSSTSATVGAGPAIASSITPSQSGSLTTSQVAAAAWSSDWRTSFSMTGAVARLTVANRVSAPTTAPPMSSALRGPATGERRIRFHDSPKVPRRIGVSMNRNDASVITAVRTIAITNCPSVSGLPAMPRISW
jgi:hypothetical protein